MRVEDLPASAQERYFQIKDAREDAADAVDKATKRGKPDVGEKRNKFDALTRLYWRLHQFIEELRLPAGSMLEVVPPGGVELEPGETLTEAIKNVRGEIAALNSHLGVVRLAPPLREHQYQEAAAYVVREACRVAPIVGFDVRGGIMLRWPDDVCTTHSDSFARECWKDPEGNVAALKRDIDQLPTPINPMWPNEKRQRISELSEQLWSQELLEQELLVAAAKDGLDVLPRPDMNPAVWLGITVVAKTEAAAVA